jgi:hypothetical protein
MMRQKMFRTLSIIGFLVALGGIAAHGVLFPCGPGSRWGIGDIIKKKVHIFTMLFLEQELSFLGRLKKLAYLLGLLCFVILFLTGFGPRLLCATELSGWLLMVHVTFAGVFIVCVAFLAVTWAHQFRFGSVNLKCVKDVFSLRIRNVSCQTCRKILFWILVVLSLPAALSILFSMFPIFGTHGQEVLFEIHRWSVLVLSVCAFVHIYLMIREGFRKELQSG